MKQQENSKKERPLFDEQELEELNYRIQVAIHTQTPVSITVFGEYEDSNLTGVIKEVDPFNKQLKIETDGLQKRINLYDVIDIHFPRN